MASQQPPPPADPPPSTPPHPNPRPPPHHHPHRSPAAATVTAESATVLPSAAAAVPSSSPSTSPSESTPLLLTARIHQTSLSQRVWDGFLPPRLVPASAPSLGGSPSQLVYHYAILLLTCIDLAVSSFGSLLLPAFWDLPIDPPVAFILLTSCFVRSTLIILFLVGVPVLVHLKSPILVAAIAHGMVIIVTVSGRFHLVALELVVLATNAVLSVAQLIIYLAVSRVHTSDYWITTRMTLTSPFSLRLVSMNAPATAPVEPAASRDIEEGLPPILRTAPEIIAGSPRSLPVGNVHSAPPKTSEAESEVTPSTDQTASNSNITDLDDVTDDNLDALSVFLPDPMTVSSVIFDTKPHSLAAPYPSAPAFSASSTSGSFPSAAREDQFALLDVSPPSGSSGFSSAQSRRHSFASTESMPQRQPQTPSLSILIPKRSAVIINEDHSVKSVDSFSGAISSQSLHEEVIVAVKAAWNSDNATAERILKHSGRHRILPRNALHLAEIQVLNYILSGLESDKKAIIDRLRVVEQLSLNILEKKDSLEEAYRTFVDLGAKEKGVGAHTYSASQTTPTLHRRPSQSSINQISNSQFTAFRMDVECCLAECLLVKGLLEVVSGREIKGALNLRKSYKLYIRLAQDLGMPSSTPSSSLKATLRTHQSSEQWQQFRNSLEHSVTFGMGFFGVMLSLVPATYAAILRSVGFPIDRDTGAASLKIVFDSNSVRSDMAALVLVAEAVASPASAVGVPSGEKWSASGDIMQTAIKIASASIEKFPQGAVAHFMHALLWARIGFRQESMRGMDRSIQFAASQGTKLPGRVLFEKGCLLAIGTDWTDAAAIFWRLWLGEDSLERIESMKSTSALADDFELRHMTGLLLIGCLFASSRSTKTTYDLVQTVKRDMALSVAAGRLKATRHTHLIATLLDGRSSIPPDLIIFATLYLRGDFARLGLSSDGTIDIQQTILPHIAKAPSSQIGSLLHAACLKVLGTHDPTDESRKSLFETASTELTSLVSSPPTFDSSWIQPNARYELSEIAVLAGNTPRAKSLLSALLHPAPMPTVNSSNSMPGEDNSVDVTEEREPQARASPWVTEGLQKMLSWSSSNQVVKKRSAGRFGKSSVSENYVFREELERRGRMLVQALKAWDEGNPAPP
ncbi:hypothetical protein DFJ73DRAFT_187716 [Zopfochytrium polystomum]|nr:hypothetical protein DFJ73DRAFT_187716 [Zopfochytrium polystomum]